MQSCTAKGRRARRCHHYACRRRRRRRRILRNGRKTQRARRRQPRGPNSRGPIPHRRMRHRRVNTARHEALPGRQIHSLPLVAGPHRVRHCTARIPSSARPNHLPGSFRASGPCLSVPSGRGWIAARLFAWTTVLLSWATLPSVRRRMLMDVPIAPPSPSDTAALMKAPAMFPMGFLLWETCPFCGRRGGDVELLTLSH